MNSSKIVLTTQDIVNKEFTIEPKGFKPQEVHIKIVGRSRYCY